MVLPLVATPGGPGAAGRGESLVLAQGPLGFFPFFLVRFSFKLFLQQKSSREPIGQTGHMVLFMSR